MNTQPRVTETGLQEVHPGDLVVIRYVQRKEHSTLITDAMGTVLRQHLELIVRDMKNPGEKVGNDVRTTLTPEALKILDTCPSTKGRLWPYNSKTMGTAFTRACQFLGIQDLHFHDLRHEGISRLFEMGWTIPHVASVSGHRTWTSLKRYTHIKQTGDKYAGWAWLDRVLSTRNQGPQIKETPCTPSST